MSYYGGRGSDPEEFDTHREKAEADADWLSTQHNGLRAGSKGTNTSGHPGRVVHRERFPEHHGAWNSESGAGNFFHGVKSTIPGF